MWQPASCSRACPVRRAIGELLGGRRGSCYELLSSGLDSKMRSLKLLCGLEYHWCSISGYKLLPSFCPPRFQPGVTGWWLTFLAVGICAERSFCFVPPTPMAGFLLCSMFPLLGAKASVVCRDLTAVWEHYIYFWLFSHWTKMKTLIPVSGKHNSPLLVVMYLKTNKQNSTKPCRKNEIWADIALI